MMGRDKQKEELREQVEIARMWAWAAAIAVVFLTAIYFCDGGHP